MNTVITTTNLRSVIATTLVSVLASTVTPVCSASDSTAAPQVIVSYEDLNVSQPQGAAALYGRIRAAAERVCKSFDSRELAYKSLWKGCVDKAIADAVVTVNCPALLAIYNAKLGQALPVALIAGQHR